MANLIPGQIIRLSEPDTRILEKHIGNEITNLETKYSDYFKKLQTWWRWHEGEPRMRQKNFPFVGASNIIIPLTRIMSDSLIARAFNTVFGAGDNVWTARTENENNVQIARDTARYTNWQGKGNDFDLRLSVYDTFSELYPMGASVMALNWRADVRWVYAPGVSGGTFRRSVAQQVQFGRGPIVESPPRENMLWDTAFNIGDAPVVVREFPMPWSKLKALYQLQPKAWDKDVIESVRGEGGQQGPSKDVTEEKKKQDSVQEFDIDASTEPLDVREVHIDFPVLENFGFSKRGMESMKTPDLPIVITTHRKTGRIIKINAEPYNLPYKPFFDFYFRKRSGRGHSVGVAKRLEQLQSGMTTQFNQAIDSQTRANAVWAITSSRKHMDSPIDPSHPIFAPGMEKEFKELKLTPSIAPNIALIQALQVMAERDMGVADPALGRETRQGGHPSPATSTLALLENTDVMSAPTMAMIRRQMSRLGEAIAILDQQFELNEDGKIHRVLGGLDGESVSEFLFPRTPIPGNYMFDMVALSPQNNPDAEMSRAVQVGQMNQLYWSQVIQGVQVMENPQVGPLVKKAWLSFIDSSTNTYMRFLDAANVDEIEKFVLNLRRAQQAGAQNLGNITGNARELAAAEGFTQQPALGGSPNAAGGGTPLSFGAVG
jgi:hypothetical protein